MGKAKKGQHISDADLHERPTPAEIDDLCAEIRRGWSKRERAWRHIVATSYREFTGEEGYKAKILNRLKRAPIQMIAFDESTFVNPEAANPENDSVDQDWWLQQIGCLLPSPAELPCKDTDNDG